MTPEQIKANAPEDANRYFQCGPGVLYFKKDITKWSYWCPHEETWFRKKIPLDFRLKTKPL